VRERLKHAKRYYDAIREILLREWDPIGVSEVPEAQDEYDGYVYKIYGMIARHELRQRLVEHLWEIETSRMGLIGDRKRAEEIADRLIGLRGEIQFDT
jgi:hypothetical protein